MNKLPYFYKGKIGNIHFSKGKNISSGLFLFFYLSLIIIVLIVLSLRLFQLTIVRGEYFRRLSEENRIKEITIEAPRGTIIDRKGFNIVRMSSSRRIYNQPEAFAHLIGYRQKADKSDITNDNCLYKLKLGDKVGKKGAEKLFECDLRGRNGKKLIEVDAKGELEKILTLILPEAGKTIQLAVDADLQVKAYNLIKEKKAAVIAIKPKTGEVLLFASSPSFNPQFFEDENTNQSTQYLSDQEHPLFNRITEATYPPGSIFKLVIATSALQEKKIDEKTTFEDTGSIKAGPLIFGNWYFLQYGKTEGLVDIVKAIRRSNDIFFYKTGELLGPEKIKKWAEIFGYGKKTNIGFEEAEGTVPSPFWKEETLKDRWYLGDTYNLSIGQGYLLTTPLQVSMITGIFANGGYLCQPQLLKSVSTCIKLPLSQKTLGLIREGMKQTCSSGGTGWPLFDFKIQTACKTGTAESHALSGIPHAWFTVFAPYENPEIALTVLIEEGGQGADVAAPIAKEILKEYFERNQ